MMEDIIEWGLNVGIQGDKLFNIVTIEADSVATMVEAQAKNEESPKLKEKVNKTNCPSTIGTYGGLKCGGKLWFPGVDDLRQIIFTKALKSKYSIHPSAGKMYKDLKRDL